MIALVFANVASFVLFFTSMAISPDFDASIGFDDRGIGLFIGSGRTLILTFSLRTRRRDKRRCSLFIDDQVVTSWEVEGKDQAGRRGLC